MTSRSKKKYSQEAMDKAIEAVHWGLSRGKAAKKFNVPSSTLADKVAGRTPIKSRIGAPTILTQDEESALIK